MLPPTGKLQLGPKKGSNGQLIQKVTKRLEQANPITSNSEAKSKAKALEKEAFQNASSREEYSQLCDISLQSQNEDATEQSAQYSALSADFTTLPPSELRIGQYTNAIHHRSGLFSTIYKALSPDDPPALVALKVTNPSSVQPPHDCHREARLLQLAASAHIIPLLTTFPQAGGLLVLSFPYVPYDLDTLLHPPASPSSSHSSPILTLSHRKSLIRDLLSALTHLHSLSLLHRDLKPSNILLHSAAGPAVLADFGIAYHPADPSSAATESEGKLITDIGTTCYRAPELLFGYTWYGAGVDLWALGCVIAEVLTWGGREVEPPAAPVLTRSVPSSSSSSVADREAGQDVDADADADASVGDMRVHWRTHGTLFTSGELGSDLALLLSIFRHLGTPSPETTWPEARTFPDWGKMEFYEFEGKQWDELLPGVEEGARDLVGRLVRFESGERMGAREALEHTWLTESGREGSAKGHESGKKRDDIREGQVLTTGNMDRIKAHSQDG
ncbi:MAG: hypothetical protein Q9165_001385 [Trypethelium subeluteriae]